MFPADFSCLCVGFFFSFLFFRIPLNPRHEKKKEFGAVQRLLNLVDLEKMLQNEYLLAKIGFDRAEKEPSKVA